MKKSRLIMVLLFLIMLSSIGFSLSAMRIAILHSDDPSSYRIIDLQGVKRFLELYKIPYEEITDYSRLGDFDLVVSLDKRMDEERARKLLEFVENGGYLLACGIPVDGDGRSYLLEVLGLNVEKSGSIGEMEVEVIQETIITNGLSLGERYKLPRPDIYLISGEATGLVLARTYSKGRYYPAMVLKRYGRGSILWIYPEIFEAYARRGDRFAHRVLLNFLILASNELEKLVPMVGLWPGGSLSVLSIVLDSRGDPGAFVDLARNIRSTSIIVRGEEIETRGYIDEYMDLARLGVDFVLDGYYSGLNRVYHYGTLYWPDSINEIENIDGLEIESEYANPIIEDEVVLGDEYSDRIRKLQDLSKAIELADRLGSSRFGITYDFVDVIPYLGRGEIRYAFSERFLYLPNVSGGIVILGRTIEFENMDEALRRASELFEENLPIIVEFGRNCSREEISEFRSLILNLPLLREMSLGELARWARMRELISTPSIEVLNESAILFRASAAERVEDASISIIIPKDLDVELARLPIGKLIILEDRYSKRLVYSGTLSETPIELTLRVR